MWKALAPLVVLAAAVPAWAAAPEPRQPIEIRRLSGSWHEIARTPNFRQKDCRTTRTEWDLADLPQVQVNNVCVGKDGKAKTVRAKAVFVDPQKNAKIRMTFLSGLVSQEYWLLDRAPDYRWLIMGTPGGNYVWIFSREAKPSAALRAEAISRASKLGYDTGRLVQSQ